jgi:hypothetical protein
MNVPQLQGTMRAQLVTSRPEYDAKCYVTTTNRTTPWLSARKRSIPTEWQPRPARQCWLPLEGVSWSAQRVLTAINLFSRLKHLLYFSSTSSFIVTRAEWTPFQTHRYSEKSGTAGNRTRDLWFCSQDLRQLDHKEGLRKGAMIQTRGSLGFFSVSAVGTNRKWRAILLWGHSNVRAMVTGQN